MFWSTIIFTYPLLPVGNQVLQKKRRNFQKRVDEIGEDYLRGGLRRQFEEERQRKLRQLAEESRESSFKRLKGTSSKLKKDQSNFRSISIKKNPDIVEYLGKNNKYRPKIVVGFSAETENLSKNSITKMRQKNCDLMVANDVSKKGIGFNSDYNQVLIFDNNGNIKSIKKNKKSFVANKIAEIILDKLLFNDRNFN